MATAINYAVRIVKNTCKDGDKIVINLNTNKFPDVEYRESCKVSVIGQKLVFTFKEKDGKTRDVGNGHITFFAKTSSLYIAKFASKKMVEDLLPFCGEYDDVVLPEAKVQSSNMPKFWIGLNQKHNLTNIYKNTSTEVTPVKSVEDPTVDINYAPAKIDLDDIVMKQPAPATIKQDVNTTNQHDILRHWNEYQLCIDIEEEAEKCASRMQKVVADLLNFRLNASRMSVDEAMGNAEFNKVVIKYANLADQVKDLVHNIRNTWGDRKKVYEDYKKKKEDYPNMTDEDLAKYFQYKGNEFQEILEANKKKEDEKSTTNKIGFGLED